MANKVYQRQKSFRLIDQMVALKISYPEASCYIRCGVLYWSGKICPSPLSQDYSVHLEYKLRKRPYVTAQGQNLKRLDDPKFPHKFHVDKEKQIVEMCLYLSPDFSSHMLLADTVIPWAVEWLYYYEIWLATDEWCGGGKHPVIDDRKVRALDEDYLKTAV